MLTAMAGGCCLLRSFPMGGRFYTEAISSSLPPCQVSLKDPLEFFCFLDHELVVLFHKGFQNWILCVTNGIIWIDYSEHFFLFT